MTRLDARQAGSVLCKRFNSSLSDGDAGAFDGTGNLNAIPGYDNIYICGLDVVAGTSSPGEVGPKVLYTDRKDGGPCRLAKSVPHIT